MARHLFGSAFFGSALCLPPHLFVSTLVELDTCSAPHLLSSTLVGLRTWLHTCFAPHFLGPIVWLHTCLALHVFHIIYTTTCGMHVLCPTMPTAPSRDTLSPRSQRPFAFSTHMTTGTSHKLGLSPGLSRSPPEHSNSQQACLQRPFAFSTHMTTGTSHKLGLSPGLSRSPPEHSNSQHKLAYNDLSLLAHT
jgi:hypothetical protein